MKYVVPLLAAEAHYFFLDKKVTKNQVSRNASLPHMAFTPANQAKPGLQNLALLRSHIARLRKFRYALQPHRPPLFCLISPEAARLTGKHKN